MLLWAMTLFSFLLLIFETFCLSLHPLLHTPTRNMDNRLSYPSPTQKPSNIYLHIWISRT